MNSLSALVVLNWGRFCSPGGDLAMPRDICSGYTGKVLLVCRGQRPSVLLNISQSPGQPPSKGCPGWKSLVYTNAIWPHSFPFPECLSWLSVPLYKYLQDTDHIWHLILWPGVLPQRSAYSRQSAWVKREKQGLFPWESGLENISSWQNMEWYGRSIVPIKTKDKVWAAPMIKMGQGTTQLRIKNWRPDSLITSREANRDNWAFQSLNDAFKYKSGKSPDEIQNR